MANGDKESVRTVTFQPPRERTVTFGKVSDRLLCRYRPVQSVGQDRALSLSGSAPPPIVELDHPLYIKFQLCRNGSVRERRLTERPLYS